MSRRIPCRPVPLHVLRDIGFMRGGKPRRVDLDFAPFPYPWLSDRTSVEDCYRLFAVKVVHAQMSVADKVARCQEYRDKHGHNDLRAALLYAESLQPLDGIARVVLRNLTVADAA